MDSSGPMDHGFTSQQSRLATPSTASVTAEEITHQTCQQPGCVKIATFGIREGKEHQTACEEHRKDGFRRVGSQATRPSDPGNPRRSKQQGGATLKAQAASATGRSVAIPPQQPEVQRKPPPHNAVLSDRGGTSAPPEERRRSPRLDTSPRQEEGEEQPLPVAPASHDTCQLHPGCTKAANFVPGGGSRPTACEEHRKEGFREVASAATNADQNQLGAPRRSTRQRRATLKAQAASAAARSVATPPQQPEVQRKPPSSNAVPSDRSGTSAPPKERRRSPRHEEKTAVIPPLQAKKQRLPAAPASHDTCQLLWAGTSLSGGDTERALDEYLEDSRDALYAQRPVPGTPVMIRNDRALSGVELQWAVVAEEKHPDENYIFVRSGGMTVEVEVAAIQPKETDDVAWQALADVRMVSAATKEGGSGCGEREAKEGGKEEEEEMNEEQQEEEEEEETEEEKGVGEAKERSKGNGKGRPKGHGKGEGKDNVAHLFPAAIQLAEDSMEASAKQSCNQWSALQIDQLEKAISYCEECFMDEDGEFIVDINLNAVGGNVDGKTHGEVMAFYYRYMVQYLSVGQHEKKYRILRSYQPLRTYEQVMDASRMENVKEEVAVKVEVDVPEEVDMTKPHAEQQLSQRVDRRSDALADMNDNVGAVLATGLSEPPRCDPSPSAEAYGAASVPSSSAAPSEPAPAGDVKVEELASGGTAAGGQGGSISIEIDKSICSHVSDWRWKNSTSMTSFPADP